MANLRASRATVVVKIPGVFLEHAAWREFVRVRARVVGALKEQLGIGRQIERLAGGPANARQVGLDLRG
jgi:hypothetical protein